MSLNYGLNTVERISTRIGGNERWIPVSCPSLCYRGPGLVVAGTIRYYYYVNHPRTPSPHIHGTSTGTLTPTVTAPGCPRVGLMSTGFLLEYSFSLTPIPQESPEEKTLSLSYLVSFGACLTSIHATPLIELLFFLNSFTPVLSHRGLLVIEHGIALTWALSIPSLLPTFFFLSCRERWKLRFSSMRFCKWSTLHSGGVKNSWRRRKLLGSN